MNVILYNSENLKINNTNYVINNHNEIKNIVCEIENNCFTIFNPSEINIIIAKRNNVTQYNGFYEFIPSGSIDTDNIIDNVVDYRRQLINELY